MANHCPVCFGCGVRTDDLGPGVTYLLELVAAGATTTAEAADLARRLVADQALIIALRRYQASCDGLVESSRRTFAMAMVALGLAVLTSAAAVIYG